VLAAQKLVNQDKIFAMAGHIGTAQNLAALPVQFDKNVINFCPLTAAREMYEPLPPSSSSRLPPYYDQMRCRLPKLVKEKNAKKVCVDLPGRRVRPGGAARRRGGLKTSA
jgi:branched-chain amino acid transport system substrate-binding protein